MAKIGIYCLGHRRPEAFLTHARELAKCKYKDFHFYLLGDGFNGEHVKELYNILGDKISLFEFPRTHDNYMKKILFAISKNHEYSIKHDEDCFLVSESWDRLFLMADQMGDEDLCATGVISNGIPTVDLFIENHTPDIKEELFNDFCNIKLAVYGPDYSSLNETYNSWDPKYYYSKVKTFPHHYKGIHPVRVSLDAVKKINNYILNNFKEVMSPKQCSIIRDNETYPYFCNGVMLIRTSEWKTIVEDISLYVDGFDEVPLNKYRDKTKKNLVIDCGIPILHTMYNWTPDWEYEKDLISKICLKIGEQ